MALGVGGGRPEISLPRSFLKVGAYACKQDSVFFVADLCEIHLVIYLFVASQLPVKVRNKTNLQTAWIEI